MKNLHRSITVSLIVMFAMGLYLPTAQADTVSAESMLNVAPQQDSAAQDALNRAVVKEKLLSLDVDPAQAQTRVDALTEEEAQKLAANIDQMPAGGGTLEILLLIIILILIL